jgi:hypothetical protein
VFDLLLLAFLSSHELVTHFDLVRIVHQAAQDSISFIFFRSFTSIPEYFRCH